MSHVTREFVMAGKAIFTVEVPEGIISNGKPHYTFRVNHKEAANGFPEAYFVSMLTGPDNEGDYSYLGMLNPTTGEVRLTKKSAYNSESFPVRLLQRILARVWSNDHASYEQHGFKTHHEGKCCRCGRKLTVPSSIESGWGPDCQKRI